MSTRTESRFTYDDLAQARRIFTESVRSDRHQSVDSLVDTYTRTTSTPLASLRDSEVEQITAIAAEELALSRSATPDGFQASFRDGFADAQQGRIDARRITVDLPYRGGWLARTVLTEADVAALGYAMVDASEAVDDDQYHGSFRLGSAAQRLVGPGQLLAGLVATGDDAVAEAADLLENGF